MSHPCEPIEPDPSCSLCDRLTAFRQLHQISKPHYHNAPVPSFGPLNARFLIIGLAPGLHGANQTGRPFTGDYAGDLLYQTLAQLGWVTGQYQRNANDGIELIDCRITNAVRCVPPENKPIPLEIRMCNNFLKREIFAMPQLRCILTLGQIAHQAALKALKQDLDISNKPFSFKHGAWHHLRPRLSLVNSYHCSRYNTQTKRLTPMMFFDVLQSIHHHLAMHDHLDHDLMEKP